MARNEGAEGTKGGWGRKREVRGRKARRIEERRRGKRREGIGRGWGEGTFIGNLEFAIGAVLLTDQVALNVLLT